MAKKATSKPKSQSHGSKQAVIDAALKLAAKKPWGEVGLKDIAKAAKISLSDLQDQFDSKADIIAAFGRMIDKKVMAAAHGDEDAQIEASGRERLFEILMERFDILNKYRTGLVSIIGSFKCDPKQAVIMLPHLCQSMVWMMEAAGVNTAGPTGAAGVMAMTGVYLKALWVWAGDDSEDLSKTMATLDKDLGRVEQLANMAGLQL